jgi:Cu+-exporting ATPase
MLIIDATSPSSAESVGSYFDSSVFLIMFILLGRVLEAYAKSRTTDAVSLLGQLRAENALLVEDNSAELGPSPEGLDANHRKTTNVPVGHLEKGDLIIVPPGSLPPTDGIIVAGLTTFDESSLTGESRPVRKGPGDEVFTGTTNLLGAVTIRITTTTGETMLEKIMRAVSEASGHKAPIEKLAESLTGVFVPVIVYLAIIVLTIWLAVAGVGVLSSRESKSGGEYFFAIEFAIATLVVACPCGIGLAVPCANAVGTGLAAREGILATTGGEAFIGATKVGVLVLDKTGTLTVGKSTVTDAENWSKLAGDMEKAERMVLEIERGSTHPLAQGLVTYLESQAQSPYRIEIMSTKESAGRGVAASVALDERLVDVLIGNVALLTENGVTLSSVQNELLRQWSEAAKSVVLVALRSNPSSPYVLTAAYALADPPRETTASALATLREMGMQIKMLSGDNILTAIAVAKMVGIPAENVIAGVSPEGKAHIIRSLQQSSWTRPRPSRLRSMISAVPWFHQFDLWRCRHRLGVMFVGDGLNDSVALAAADVSVAMGHGSQATLAGSDFVLLSSTLSSLPALIKLSKRITRRQKLNLGWACVFNIVCLPFAAGVFYPAGGIRLTPVWSAVIMACSSLSVVCSSIALRWGI